MGPLLPFEELVSETEMEDESCKEDEDGRSYSSEDCNLPDPCALLNITSRRKVPLKKQSPFVVCTLPLWHVFILKFFPLSNMILAVRRTANY